MNATVYSSRPRAARGTLPLVVLLAATACGDRAPAPPADGPAQLEALPELTLTEEVRIGSVDDPEVGFSRIAGVDVGADGRVYVLDGQEMQIRVLSTEGEIVARIGGPGEGPGEFQGFVRFGVQGDTLWTFDPRANRITLFDTSGSVLDASTVERVRVPLPGTYATVLPDRMEPGGTFLGWMGMVGRSRDDPEPDVSENDDLSWPRVRFGAGGEVVDTAGRVHRPPPRLWRPSSEEEGGAWRFVEVAGQRRLVPSPPTLLPQWHALSDGYVVVRATLPDATGGGVSMTRVAASGDTVGRTEVAYEAGRWTDAELDSVAALSARTGGVVMMGGGQPPPPDNWQEIAARLRAEMDFPAYRVGLDYSWSARDGWLLLRFSEGEAASMATFVVVDAAGGIAGRFDVPKGVRPLWTDGTTLWVSEPDELDVPWLVRYRMR